MPTNYKTDLEYLRLQGVHRLVGIHELHLNKSRKSGKPQPTSDLDIGFGLINGIEPEVGIRSSSKGYKYKKHDVLKVSRLKVDVYSSSTS